MSGSATTAGGPPITIGGSEIPIPTLTSAIVVTGKTHNNAKRIVPKNNFFILSPSYKKGRPVDFRKLCFFLPLDSFCAFISQYLPCLHSLSYLLSLYLKSG